MGSTALAAGLGGLGTALGYSQRKNLLGGYDQKNIDLMNPQQMQILSQILQQPGLGQQFGQNVSNLLTPQGPEAYQEAFQKGVVDPAMMQYQQRVLPSIQQRFIDANAGSSSALNDALAQSAQDLTTQLGAQYGQFFQNQQNLDLSRANLGLGTIQNLLGQRTFEPFMERKEGLLGPLLKAGQLGLKYYSGGAA